MQRGTRMVKPSRRICEKFLTNSTGSGKRKTENKILHGNSNKRCKVEEALSMGS